MGNNLRSEFLLDGVEEGEFLHLLQSHYGSARSTPDNSVEYPNSDRWALKIRAKSGKITVIESGPAFSPAELSTLLDKIKAQLLDSTGVKTERNILFSSHPVKGSMRFDSHIQILPAPPHAPRPSVLVGDHPFILEFPLKQSSNASLTIMRKTRLTLEWTWFLNAVLRSRIKTIGPRTDHLWVLCCNLADEIPTQKHIKWAREFYMIDNFVMRADDFSTPTEPIQEIPTNEYYGESVHRYEDLVVPDNLRFLTNAFASLTGDRRIRFVRAIHWASVAFEHWNTLASSFYIALVAAIESLMGPTPSTEKCPSCGRDKGPGPTQRFHDFVEQFSAGSDPESKKPLYGLRSKLAHGEGLLELDESPWTIHFHTTALDEREQWTRLTTLVRVVVINWLIKTPE